jgi:hypothetical protein
MATLNKNRAYVPFEELDSDRIIGRRAAGTKDEAQKDKPPPGKHVGASPVSYTEIAAKIGGTASGLYYVPNPIIGIAAPPIDAIEFYTFSGHAINTSSGAPIVS